MNNQEESKPSVGKNIRTFRERHNLSQTYMAEKLNISQPEYSKIENDMVLLTVDRLIEIAKLLGVPEQSIIDLTDSKMYNIHDNTFERSSISTNIMNNQNKSEEIKALYEKLLAEKDERIAEKDELIQHLKAETDRQKAENEKLKEEIERLKEEIERLKKG